MILNCSKRNPATFVGFFAAFSESSECPPKYAILHSGKREDTRCLESKESQIFNGCKSRKIYSLCGCEVRAQIEGLYCNVTNWSEINRNHVAGSNYHNIDDHMQGINGADSRSDLHGKVIDEDECSSGSKVLYAASSSVPMREKSLGTEALHWIGNAGQTILNKAERIRLLF